MKLPPIFNPSNDMALAANVRQYQPPPHIQQMEDDLQSLSNLWESGPWGWSLDAKQRYLRMGIPETQLPSDAWLAQMRHLSSRQFACRYAEQLYAHLQDTVGLVTNEMQFLTRLPDRWPPMPVIAKSPWSSSGRGNIVVNEPTAGICQQLQGVIRRQGGILLDRYYSKQTDFALEFWVHDHETEFIGLSVFSADETGHYGGNYVESQASLRQRITMKDELLKRLIDHHRQHLSTLPYRGPVGIDMLATTEGEVHPLVEINFRRTMGLLSILLYSKGMVRDQLLTPQRTHGFVAAIREGKLSITFNRG